MLALLRNNIQFLNVYWAETDCPYQGEQLIFMTVCLFYSWLKCRKRQKWNEYLFAITQRSTFICLDKPAVFYLLMFSIRVKYWPGFSWLVQQQITFCISTANMFTFFPYSSKLITINTSTSINLWLICLYLVTGTTTCHSSRCRCKILHLNSCRD